MPASSSARLGSLSRHSEGDNGDYWSSRLNLASCTSGYGDMLYLFSHLMFVF